MTDDLALLRRYAARDPGAQEAFTALVQRHVNLVYSVAPNSTPCVRRSWPSNARPPACDSAATRRSDASPTRPRDRSPCPSRPLSPRGRRHGVRDPRVVRRRSRMRQLAALHPERVLPEMKLLTEEDWHSLGDDELTLDDPVAAER